VSFFLLEISSNSTKRAADEHEQKKKLPIKCFSVVHFFRFFSRLKRENNEALVLILETEFQEEEAEFMNVTLTLARSLNALDI
jgi:hypothetical protein